MGISLLIRTIKTHMCAVKGGTEWRKRTDMMWMMLTPLRFQSLYMSLWQGVCCRWFRSIMKAMRASGHLPNGKRKKKLRRKILHKRTGRIAMFVSPPGFAFTNLQFPRYNNKSEPISDWIKIRIILIWWRRRGSNPWPLRCERSALPAELRPRL